MLKLSIDKVKTGDLIFLKGVKSRRMVTHVAMVISSDYLFHSSKAFDGAIQKVEEVFQRYLPFNRRKPLKESVACRPRRKFPAPIIRSVNSSDFDSTAPSTPCYGSSTNASDADESSVSLSNSLTNSPELTSTSLSEGSVNIPLFSLSISSSPSLQSSPSGTDDIDGQLSSPLGSSAFRASIFQNARGSIFSGRSGRWSVGTGMSRSLSGPVTALPIGGGYVPSLPVRVPVVHPVIHQTSSTDSLSSSPS